MLTNKLNDIELDHRLEKLSVLQNHAKRVTKSEKFPLNNINSPVGWYLVRLVFRYTYSVIKPTRFADILLVSDFILC